MAKLTERLTYFVSPEMKRWVEKKAQSVRIPGRGVCVAAYLRGLIQKEMDKGEKKRRVKKPPKPRAKGARTRSA